MHPPSTQKRTNHLQGENKEYPGGQKQSITCKHICSTKTNNKQCLEINREMKQCIQKTKPFKLKVALPDDLGPHLPLLFVSFVKTLFSSVQNSFLSSWNPYSPSLPANFPQISLLPCFSFFSTFFFPFFFRIPPCLESHHLPYCSPISKHGQPSPPYCYTSNAVGIHA